MPSLTSTKLELPYKPFARQAEFHASTAKYRLFGGAAGPGKSFALLMEGVNQANEVPSCDTLLLRRTFPELEASLLTYFRRDVPRDLYRSFNDSKHVVTWWNDSTTRFGYCQSENDVYQYQGAEYLFIGIDELTHFTLKQWQFLTSRNRCPVPKSFPNMAGATNPGNVGHAWVKSLWIDKKPAAGMEDSQNYRPEDYAFIRATIFDNPIYANDADYRRTLESLPRQLRALFLEGSWDVFAGQYFDIWNVGKHVVTTASIGMKDWWNRWVSIDWGFEHPSAVYWHTTSPEGRHYTYREYVQNHLTPRMLATHIAERSKGENISQIFLSPDAFAKRTDDDTIAVQIDEQFDKEKLPRVEKADNDRVGGWMLMYSLLQNNAWFVTDTCHKLIEKLPLAIRDDEHVEDLIKADGDDELDATRYGLKSRLGAGSKPLAERVDERISATDPTSVMIWRKKFERQELNRVAPVHFSRRRFGR